jgi:hypothetical protein
VPMRRFGLNTLAAVLIFVALFAATATAQIEIKTEQAKAISGLSEPSVVGELVLFIKGSPKVKSVGVIYVEAVGEVSVEATDEKRQPVQVSRVSDGVYLVDRPGSTWVEVSEYGEVELAGGQKRKILLDRKTAVVVVDDPTPPPGPGPGPSPPGPGPSPTPDLFDGLAGKVSQLSRNMDLQKKLQLTSVLDTIAQKMDRGEFLQIRQSAEYLTANRPQCTPQSGCAELYNFMAADARGRMLSFEQAKQYYREIAKGLRQ